MVHALNKGKTAEREICSILNEEYIRAYNCVSQSLSTHDATQFYEILSTTGLVKRNLQQSQNGGFDILNTGIFAVEIKRQEQLAINSWWAQAERQTPLGCIPVLMYKQSRKPWIVMTRGAVVGPQGEVFGANTVVTMLLDRFRPIFFEQAKRELLKGVSAFIL